MNAGDVRDRILNEAKHLFAHKGFGATSVREVVDAVGVTKPTLYYWFSNKDALFLEVVGAQVAMLRELVSQTLGGPGGAVDRLHAFVAAYIDAAVHDPDGVRLMMTVQHPNDAGQPEVDLLSVQQHTIDAVRDVLEGGRVDGAVREDVDPCVAALALLGAANMHIVAAVHGMGLPEDVVDRLLSTFLHGVARCTATPSS